MSAFMDMLETEQMVEMAVILHHQIPIRQIMELHLLILCGIGHQDQIFRRSKFTSLYNSNRGILLLG